MIKVYKGIEPKIDESAFISDSTHVIGQVNIDKNVNIWYGTVIRADDNSITIGENTNIQDLSVVHVSKHHSTIIGKNVTIGHKSIIHGCEIGNNTLIGMGSIVLDGAKIGEFTLIGAGSLVPPGKEIPSGVLAMGSPVKVIRELSQQEKDNLTKSALEYVKLANNYK